MDAQTNHTTAANYTWPMGLLERGGPQCYVGIKKDRKETETARAIRSQIKQGFAGPPAGRSLPDVEATRTFGCMERFPPEGIG